MSPTHRPLSAWIIEFHATTGTLGRVNEGNHRVDARQMSVFADGWRRTGVPVAPDTIVLGLTDAEGSVVVEVDDLGRPIRVTPTGLGVVERVERQWPTVDDDLARAIGSLSTESLPMRFWLIDRLDTEGTPPDGAYVILPWDLLEQLCRSVLAGLLRTDQGEVTEVADWLAPAIPGLTGPLEQLDAGLRSADSAVARRGATAFLLALRDVPLPRIPESSRHALAAVARRIGEVDGQFVFLSRLVGDRLASAGNGEHRGLLLDSRQEAAASGQEVRERVETRTSESQRVRLTVSRNALVQAQVRIARWEGPAGPFGRSDAVFFPLRFTSRTTKVTSVFWVALTSDADYLTGTISVQLPDGRSEVDVDGPPFVAEDLVDVDASVLVASYRASNRPTKRRWRETARELDGEHPIRVAVATAEGPVT